MHIIAFFLLKTGSVKLTMSQKSSNGGGVRMRNHTYLKLKKKLLVFCQL
jgi:hypothetical protein